MTDALLEGVRLAMSAAVWELAAIAREPQIGGVRDRLHKVMDDLTKASNTVLLYQDVRKAGG